MRPLTADMFDQRSGMTASSGITCVGAITFVSRLVDTIEKWNNILLGEGTDGKGSLEMPPLGKIQKSRSPLYSHVHCPELSEWSRCSGDKVVTKKKRNINGWI